MSDATRILKAAHQGDAGAAGQLLTLVYDELRVLAAQRLCRESPDQTLQATALVHEAWLKLIGGQGQTFQNRAHFFAAAAEAMRRILINRARYKKALRHGGALERVPFENIELPVPDDDGQLVAIHEALDKLAAQCPRQAELVKLRYFVGMTNEEAAEVLGISITTAKVDWSFARAWLYDEIKSGLQTNREEVDVTRFDSSRI